MRIILAVLAISVVPAEAQVLYGGLVGTVIDQQGAVVPGARMTIVNMETSLTRETTTDAQGAYSFVNVLAGPYDVKVALQGFREAVRSRVPVTVGQISRVDLRLEVGALSEGITVESSPQLLQTDKADVHTELKSTEITNLPLNRFRNYQALVVLVPGSLPPAFQNAETDTPQRSLNMTVNGQDGAANTTLTDGTRNVNVGLPHHNVYVAPAETIETVNITTGSMDAEEGMAAGVAITVITKSGTNTLRGSAFEFFNNEKLNATPYYFGRGAVPTKLPINRQTFGGRWEGRSATINSSSSGRTKATRAGRISSLSSTYRMRRCAMATSATRSTQTARCSGSTTRSRATWRQERAGRSSRTTASRQVGSTQSRDSCSTCIPCRTSKAQGRGASQATTALRARARRIATTSTSRSI
jgi:hypothetical protein